MLATGLIRNGILSSNSKIAFRHQCNVVRYYSFSNSSSSTTRRRSRIGLHSLSSSSRLWSSFEAPLPPESRGRAVYDDVDLTSSASVISPEARRRNEDPDAVFVVTGASRGIGLQFVKSLLERTQGRIVACCRTPSDLEEFSDNDRVRVVRLDLEDDDTMDGLVATLDTARVDALFNVAGLLGDGVTTPGPERSLQKLDRKWIDKTLAVNLVGPVLLCQRLAPLLKVGRTNISNAGPGTRPKTVVVNLSARVGSVSDNQLGGWYSYRFSKAGLNQATRTMAHELKRQGTWVVALHPGTTDTDLSRPFQKNVAEGRLFPVDFTVKQLLDVVDRMDETHSGGLFDWAGKAIPF